MRLIDADNLKSELTKWFPMVTLDGIEAKTLFAQIMHDIDNTPTVELFCSYLSDGEVRQPCVEGPCEQDRPQGEWIWLGDNPNPNHKWSCNKCGRGVKEQENFCRECGVKMVKGEQK